MSFIGSIREILKTSDRPLSIREIHNRLEKSYPDCYGTPAQLNKVENGRHEDLEHAVLAQIEATCDSERAIVCQRFAKPLKYRLKSRAASPQHTRTIPARSTSSVKEHQKDESAQLKPQNKQNGPITITWHRCKTYDEAKKYTQSVYLHEWSGLPFKWGKVENAFFGGRTRRFGGEVLSAQYGLDCKHWIEGCLRHGAQLFIGTVNPDAVELIDDVETFLISQFGHEMRRKAVTPNRKLKIQHFGQMPRCILDSKATLKKAA